MFLSQITSDELKQSFIELAHYVAGVDGHVHESEQEYIEQYMYEMGLEELTPSDRTLDQILAVVEDAHTKNIFFIEILALIFADGHYNEEEKQAVHVIREAFGFSQEKYESYKNWVISMSNLQSEGVRLVAED